eukprot:CAMPEP_0119108160 /NCGR_PEP_ID=MMETSP1180-20130426/13500_1 /TAXON_ID=3052 ORGANISM="Chlamydomonas cf sp, Strain CCMP681" /NCGR_SAMPLE_ID=MMETSP1180 /ASSEMBLY_ACC=CAM_ASM_000741 /LENGTH=331 /DNA_ID=CAMNT_0007093747 /DNA_START=179 /DNA_END=1174 /DNA_ORIENTATION=+
MAPAAPPTSVKDVAKLLRERKGVTYGSAKLELPEGSQAGSGMADILGNWLEYIRGKDLVRWIEANPGKVDVVLKEKPGRTPDETAGELIRVFISQGYALRTERKYKRPKPGRTRLVKWPRTLILLKDQQWDPEAFYVWRQERPASMWFWISSVAIPLVVVAACLFPLAPWWARISVVYTMMVLLLALLGTMLVRYVLFCAIWVMTGSTFWLFPNMMSDKVGLLEAFMPISSWERTKRMSDQWQARLVSAFVMTGMVWVLAVNGPDAKTLKSEARDAHEGLLHYIESMFNHNQSSITDGKPSNATDASQRNKARAYSGHNQHMYRPGQPPRP